MGNHRRTRAFDNGGQIVQRHHLARIRAHIKIVQVFGGHAEGLIGLHEDSIGAVVVVEVVDVFRAHEDAERGGDLRERNVYGLGLFAIDGHQHLWVVG